VSHVYRRPFDYRRNPRRVFDAINTYKLVTPSDRIYAVDAETRVWPVGAESRTWPVDAETRVYEVR